VLPGRILVRPSRLSRRRAFLAAVEGEEAASVPSHPGDGAGDGGEARISSPLPFETIHADRYAMQDASVFANEDRSDTDRRMRSRPSSGVILPVLTKASATPVRARAGTPEGCGKDCARARADVADFGHLLAPGQDAIQQRGGQGLRGAAAEKRAPSAALESAVMRSSPGALRRLPDLCRHRDQA